MCIRIDLVFAFHMVCWSHFFLLFSWIYLFRFCLESQKRRSHTEPVFLLSHLLRRRAVSPPSRSTARFFFWAYCFLLPLSHAPSLLLAVSSTFGFSAAWLVFSHSWELSWVWLRYSQTSEYKISTKQRKRVVYYLWMILGQLKLSSTCLLFRPLCIICCSSNTSRTFLFLCTYSVCFPCL